MTWLSYALIGSGGAGAVATMPPDITSVTISNPITSGDTVSCSVVWSGLPFAGVSYQWKADGSNIVGAVGSIYVTTSADVGKALSCLVSIDNGVGTDNLESAAYVVAAGLNEVWDGGQPVTDSGIAVIDN